MASKCCFAPVKWGILALLSAAAFTGGYYYHQVTVLRDAAKWQLGRHLFYEPRLSARRNLSCGSCHQQALGFSDGRQHSAGTHGDVGRRNSATLVNLASQHSFTWANPLQTDLAFQALIPLLGEEPIELGLQPMLAERLQALNNDEVYQDLLAELAEPALTQTLLLQALAQFQLSLVSHGTAFDRYMAGEKRALTLNQQAGKALFFSERFQCSQCHGGDSFNLQRKTTTLPEPSQFHNTGLYNVAGSYPERDLGLYEVTFNPQDNGKFKTPSLRNIVQSAPYMHDGSMATLRQVMEHYRQGGSQNLQGVAGDGRDHPNKSHLVQGFEASEQELDQVISFLDSLSDPDLLYHPRFANPWLPRAVNP
ncbi:cytochrome c peroxidase [Motilimonas pumila]|uniref:Di-heme enzyme n=1 Tax=Motilimonas pumila TaxID=2303987 RepID=A0A418YE55_9GAMM|nr:cytochrome c peroxidase [Motilimonas pumila]RJG42801.1 di-heme enzyme [Motilimonas pumila]